MIGSKLYVGNLYLRANKEQLRRLFLPFGTVRGIELVEGTGFGFVETSSVEEAESARRALDGTEFLERVIRVKSKTFLHLGHQVLR